MRYPVLAVSILATGILAAAPAKPPVDENQVVSEMDALVERTAPPSAREKADADALVQRGTKAHDAKRYDDALALYRKALGIDPLLATAYYEMAFTFSQMGEQAKALDSVIRSIALDPKFEGAYVLKGNVLDDLGFPEAAKATYQALLEIQPASYMGHLNLGLCESRLGNTKAAREEMTKARDIDPKRPSSYFQLAKNARLDGCEYEERDNLNKFLEVGAKDPRADIVKARLKELNDINITVNPKDPYSTIDMIEKMARATWRSKTHRQRHPEACGYALTFDEEKEILSTFVIPEWRKIKAGDPKAQHPDYDLLVKIDDAGFLDEYIYDTKTSALGEPGKKWLADHADRKAAFEAWARRENLLAGPESADRPADIPLDIIKTMTDSKVHYVLEEAQPEESERFLTAERKRFKEALKLHGDDGVDCGKAGAVSSTELAAAGIKLFYPVFRCRLPGDDVFEDATKRASLLGLAVRDLSPAIQGAVVQDAGGVHVKLADAAWLTYLNAKAAWRHEPELRKRYGGGETDVPSVEEEVFAFLAATQAYHNSREPDGNREAAPENAGLERLSEIEKAGHLRGFVLYEVIHRRYGITLKSLSTTDGRAVDDYLSSHVLVRAGGA